MQTRTLGKSNIKVSALGLGCWAIGGPSWRGDLAMGWGEVDDNESIAAIHRAIDLGVNFIDTANSYGCGHSERVIGEALQGKRDNVIIATKFNSVFDEEKKQGLGSDATPEGIRSACDASLERLQTDCIDLYQFHDGQHDLEKAIVVRQTLEELVDAGKIRFYGWSTDDAERAELFAQGEHCTAIQQAFNLFGGRDDTLEVCEQNNLASINRCPLDMGLISGKYKSDSTISKSDIRSRFWNLTGGEHAQKLELMQQIKNILTEDGRTAIQGALAWLWARSEVMIPIPGFRTVAQIEENAASLNYDPLTEDQMKRIATILDN